MIDLNITLLSSIKIAILVAEVVYAIFAYMVVKQTALMNKSFQTPIHMFFTLLSQAHFFATVGLFVLSLIIL